LKFKNLVKVIIVCKGTYGWFKSVLFIVKARNPNKEYWEVITVSGQYPNKISLTYNLLITKYLFI